MLSHSRRSIMRLAAVAAFGSLVLSTATASAEIKKLDLIAPANPGGGWDQTARYWHSATSPGSSTATMMPCAPP